MFRRSPLTCAVNIRDAPRNDRSVVVPLDGSPGADR
jgi:hypothetical protein